MKLAELKESLNSIATGLKLRQTENGARIDFALDDKKYSIFFTKTDTEGTEFEPYKIMDLSFGIDGGGAYSFTATKGSSYGDTAKVFSTVVAATVEYVKMAHIDGITFSSEKRDGGDDEQTYAARTSLYKRMARILAAREGFTHVTNNIGHKTNFMIYNNRLAQFFQQHPDLVHEVVA